VTVYEFINNKSSCAIEDMLLQHDIISQHVYGKSTSLINFLPFFSGNIPSRVLPVNIQIKICRAISLSASVCGYTT